MKKNYLRPYIKRSKESGRGDGFISIVVLLVSLLIIGFLFIKIYSTPKASDGKTQIENYSQAIKDTENIKNSIEIKNTNEDFSE